MLSLIYLTGKRGDGLRISYKTKKLEKECTEYNITKKNYGERMAEKIHQRINEISAAISEESLVQYSVGNCHGLDGKRKGQYAMDLVHPFRLVFFKTENDDCAVDLVHIIEIVDYH